MLIALREMKVGRKQKFDENGEPVLTETGSPVFVDDIRHPGEEVPEAENWPKLHDLLENGFLERVTRETDILDRLTALEAWRASFGTQPSSGTQPSRKKVPSAS